MFDTPYPVAQTCEGMQVQPKSLLERLRDRKSLLEAQLKEVDEAVKSLESNPQVADALEKVSRVTFRGL